jgi:hypothetical protein
MRCCTASSTTSRLKDQHNSALTSLPPPAGPPIRRKPKSAHEARPPRAMRDVLGPPRPHPLVRTLRAALRHIAHELPCRGLGTRRV